MSDSLIICSHCSASNPSNEYFCDTCGYTLSASVSAGAVSATPTGQLPIHNLLRKRYRILQTIGQGGMGAIYLAQDTALGDRLVAVKEMSQNNGQQSQEAVKNFQREAYLLASLQHPNLPSMYDHFEEDGRWYLAMSFIQGETVEEYLAHMPGQRLPLDEVLRIGLQLCNVLSYLHSHHPPIIFRDLKPDNIMRTNDGHLYLIDFGIARHFKPGQAKDTASYGSAGYAPPEQYGKAQTTERSDIYSLGVTLYQLLSGYDPSQSPFRLPSLRSLVPTLPTSLVTLITNMLELDESKRPATVSIVQDLLQQLTLSPSSAVSKTTATPPFQSTQSAPSASVPQQSLLPRSTSPMRSKKLVMVIDSSATVRKIVESCLRREGFDVVCFADGVGAFKWLTTSQGRIPHLLFIDIQLARMDGYDVARRLKTIPQFSNTVVIMLSRKDGHIDKLKARLAGAKDFISKPFKTDNLISITHAYIGYPDKEENA